MYILLFNICFIHIFTAYRGRIHLNLIINVVNLAIFLSILGGSEVLPSFVKQENLIKWKVFQAGRF